MAIHPIVLKTFQVVDWLTFPSVASMMIKKEGKEGVVTGWCIEPITCVILSNVCYTNLVCQDTTNTTAAKTNLKSNFAWQPCKQIITNKKTIFCLSRTPNLSNPMHERQWIAHKKNKTPTLLNAHWREIKFSPLSGIKTQWHIFRSLEDRVFMRIKTVPPQLSLASQNWAAGVTSPAKATDICKSYRVQLHATESSITHGNLAANSQGSHAGWAPNSSVNTVQHFTTKEDWLRFGGVCTPVHPLVVKKNLFLFTSRALYILRSLWEPLGAVVHRGNWMDRSYT